MAVLAGGRVGTDLFGHFWHLVNTERKLMMLKTGTYLGLDLYGNGSRDRVGTDLLVLLFPRSAPDPTVKTFDLDLCPFYRSYV